MKPKTIELVKDIFAFAVILMRTGNEDILEDWKLFAEVLNQATDEHGVRSFLPPTGKRSTVPQNNDPTDKKFTPESLRKLFERLPKNSKRELLAEFEDAIENLNISLGETASGFQI